MVGSIRASFSSSDGNVCVSTAEEFSSMLKKLIVSAIVARMAPTAIRKIRQR